MLCRAKAHRSVNHPGIQGTAAPPGGGAELMERGQLGQSVSAAPLRSQRWTSGRHRHSRVWTEMNTCNPERQINIH